VRASHDWQYSTDGGKTWTAVPTTLQGKTAITGLTPGSSLVVRHRAVTKAGADDWSLTQALIVV
jgi:hypothetical protein